MMKRLAIWTGLVAASWAFVLGLVMCARHALAQNPIPEHVQKEALEGIKRGGYEGMFWLTAGAAAALGLALAWVVKKMVDHLQAGAAVALEQAKADVRTGDRLTAIENGLRAKGIIS